MSTPQSSQTARARNAKARTREGLHGSPHLTLAALFVVSQVGFIYALHNRSNTLVYSIAAVTLGSLLNVYQLTKRTGGSPRILSLAWPALLQSLPLNLVLYAVAYSKDHINGFLDTRAHLHSRVAVVSSAFLYAAITFALIFSAYVSKGLPSWAVRGLETAAFLALIGHIVVTTSDTEGLIDVLTMSAAALATFSTKLYWSQSFEVFHPPGAHGRYDGPVDTVADN